MQRAERRPRRHDIVRVVEGRQSRQQRPPVIGISGHAFISGLTSGSAGVAPRRNPRRSFVPRGPFRAQPVPA